MTPVRDITALSTKVRREALGATAVAPKVVSYETQLNQNPRWALYEGSRHFEEKSAVFEALHKIARRLTELNISYAVVGGMALFAHNYRRYTEDVNILVTRDDLKIIHDNLEGLGYRPPYKGSKHLRDMELGVKIEFLTSGGFPGDGKPKPVAFPDPREENYELNGVRYVDLSTLLELKLSSGMTSPARMKDLADAQELIKALNLPADYSLQLNPYVQEKFNELWVYGRQRFVKRWLKNSTTPEQMVALQQDGITIEQDATREDIALLVTSDPDIARKYDMHEESEYWADSPEPTDDADSLS